MGIKVVTQPTAEPLTVDEVKANSRIDGTVEDALLVAFIAGARKRAEQFTQRSIAEQTLELSLDRFPCAEIELPRGPVRAIESVIYIDENGAEQTLDPVSYALDDSDEDSWWLLPAVGFAWPATAAYINAVKVRFLAGYSSPDADPQTLPLEPDIRIALLLMVGDMNENRENSAEVELYEIPMNAKSWLQAYRLGMGV